MDGQETIKPGDRVIVHGEAADFRGDFALVTVDGSAPGSGYLSIDCGSFELVGEQRAVLHGEVAAIRGGFAARGHAAIPADQGRLSSYGSAIPDLSKCGDKDAQAALRTPKERVMSFREQLQEQFREQIRRLTTLRADATRRSAQLRARAGQAATSSGLSRRLNWRTLRHAAAAASEMRPKWQPQPWLAKVRDFRRRGNG